MAKVISLTAETNSVRVVQEWNKLSQDVVDAMSVIQLKNRWTSSGKDMGIKSLA